MHQSKSTYEKAIVAYALSFAPKEQYGDAQNTSYDLLKATANDEVDQGDINQLNCTDNRLIGFVPSNITSLG